MRVENCKHDAERVKTCRNCIDRAIAGSPGLENAIKQVADAMRGFCMGAGVAGEGTKSRQFGECASFLAGLDLADLRSRYRDVLGDE